MTQNSLTQYLSLYQAEARAIAQGAPALLNAPRREAFEALAAAGRLPDRSDEGFEKTSVAEMFAPDFGVNTRRMPLQADVAASFKCGVPNLSTLMAFVVNDRFAPSATLQRQLPDGVTGCSMAQAASTHAALVARYYGSVAPLSLPGVALNTMFVHDGVFVHIAKGVRLSRPLQLVNIFSTEFDLLAFRRVLIVAEAGAEVSVLKCDHSQRDGVGYLSSEVVEIVALDGARVGWYDLEESTPATGRYSQVFVSQGRDSRADLCNATLANGTTRNELRVFANAPGTHTSLYGMAIASRQSHIDNFSAVTHAAEHGTSDQTFRYILLDRASGAFEGSIEVCHGARFTEAFQSNRNLLGSDDARMHTRPQLLIYNDDVKCSHGATTGQLDSRALFYMEARGIPAAVARHMLMQAFMAPVIQSIPLEPLRDRLSHLVDIRLSGMAAGCGDCTGACADAAR
ncbi:MAG: Fe-S cluster assembly protein SufD [Muribaculaceae bacterium]|nr:Fe-S cluster assembly protein SufD [Muribaculaceae bacterium]